METDLQFVKLLPAITTVINTRLDSGGRCGDLNRSYHGRSPFDCMCLMSQSFWIGVLHKIDPHLGICEKGGDHLAEGVGGHGPSEAIEDGEVQDLIRAAGVGRSFGGGRPGNPGEDFMERLRRQRFLQYAVVPFNFGGWSGAHGQQKRAGCGLTQAAGEVGTRQRRHLEVSEDAIRGRSCGDLVERLLTALRLQDFAALGFEENAGQGKADRVVIDGEDAARGNCLAETHIGHDCTHAAR